MIARRKLAFAFAVLACWSPVTLALTTALVLRADKAAIAADVAGKAVDKADKPADKTGEKPAEIAAEKKADKKADKKPDRLEVLPATGRDTVQYSKDIAPVLVENCFTCHSGRQPRARFQMGTFNDLIRGGVSGNPWVPFQPADSLLIKKLKGTEGKRMPQPDKRDPLPADTIAKFEKWIAEGARFDGPDPKQSTQMLAALTRAKNASPTELASDRLSAAKHMWLLADPNDKPNFKETKNLLIVGALPTAKLDEVARTGEQECASLAKWLHITDAELVKGGVTLFVFPARYDYSEFGRMVENRTLPRDWRGHWKYNTVDAYAAVVEPGEAGDYSLGGIIEQQLAAVYIASLGGKTPDWFAEGAGRALAARTDPRSPRVRDWNDRLKQLAEAGLLEKFGTGGLSPGDNLVAGYAFVCELMTSPAKFTQLLDSLKDGETFDASFMKSYGTPLGAATAIWAKNAK